jgi:AcrR family transcriptional regulator
LNAPLELGRGNQKRRTRKALLEAASRLMKQGRNPTLEEVAEEALVSRATAYRYFPSVDALLLEAPLDVAVPDAQQLFRPGSSDDPILRLERVDAALHEMILAHEAPLRLMIARSLERRAKGESENLPARQNRRSPLIAAALEPAGARFDPKTLDTLKQALALVIGTEAMLVLKDVLQLDERSARKVRRWAISALVNAALKQDGETGGEEGAS